MKTLSFSMMMILAVLFVACGSGSNTVTEPTIGKSYRSECLRDAQGPTDAVGETDSVEIQVFGNSIKVIDHNAVFNCCLKSWLEVYLEGTDIVVVEVEEEDPDMTHTCDCECPFELSIDVAGLENGQYDVSVYYRAVSENTLLHKETISIQAAEQPIVGEPYQSKCHKEADSLVDNQTIEIFVLGNTIEVVDHNTTFNCCLKAWMEVSLEGGEIVIVEKEEEDQSNACDCVCPRELSIGISNLGNGQYKVKVYKWAVSEEALLYQETVEVGAGA